MIVLVGGAFILVERNSNKNYYEEITQRLNASISMYVTGERQLIKQGEVDEGSFKQLAKQAMILNSTVEVYLLDKQGLILSHSLPHESIQTRQVELDPLQELLDASAKMPIRGTDPANRDQDKIFSAFPVMDAEQLQGYLYVILGGQKYEQLAEDIRGSYVQTTMRALLAIIVIALLSGLLVFSLMTRRLSRLTLDVTNFTESNFDPDLIIAKPDSGTAQVGDEIRRLRLAFGHMAVKIQQQFEKLKETDSMRRELVTNVSHDLRTPLASIHGYVETLLLKNETLSSDERQHHLEITRKHTKRLGRLVSDLFDLSRLEAHSINLSCEVFSMAELLHDVIQQFELEASRKNIQVTVHGDHYDSMVSADINLIQRVLENLFHNALKYTPAGGKIDINMQRSEKYLKIAIADTGCGIPKNDIDQIFARYYHGESKGSEYESTGLGLAIVSKILELHGSRITVQSVINEGALFEFNLPMMSDGDTLAVS